MSAKLARANAILYQLHYLVCRKWALHLYDTFPITGELLLLHMGISIKHHPSSYLYDSAQSHKSNLQPSV